jgi:hypothetical protein
MNSGRIRIRGTLWARLDRTGARQRGVLRQAAPGFQCEKIAMTSPMTGEGMRSSLIGGRASRKRRPCQHQRKLLQLPRPLGATARSGWRAHQRHPQVRKRSDTACGSDRDLRTDLDGSS